MSEYCLKPFWKMHKQTVELKIRLFLFCIEFNNFIMTTEVCNTDVAVDLQNDKKSYSQKLVENEFKSLEEEFTQISNSLSGI